MYSPTLTQQHWHDLRNCQKYKFSGPTLGLLNQTPGLGGAQQSLYFIEKGIEALQVNTNVQLLVSYYRRWFKLGPEGFTVLWHWGRDQHAVFGRWYWTWWSWDSYIEGGWEAGMEARNKGLLFPQTVRSPWRIYAQMNSGIYRKSNLKAADMCLHSILLLLLKLLTLLTKLYSCP